MTGHIEPRLHNTHPMTTTTETKRTIAELSVDTIALRDRLKTAQAGEVITYESLSELIGRNVQGKARSNLNSARRQLLRDPGLVFDVIINEGLKLLSDSEVVQVVPERGRSRIRSECRRVSKSIDTVEFEKLNGADKVKTLAARSVFGALAMVAKETSATKIEEHVAGMSTKATLPTAKALELFK